MGLAPLMMYHKEWFTLLKSMWKKIHFYEKLCNKIWTTNSDFVQQWKLVFHSGKETATEEDSLMAYNNKYNKRCIRKNNNNTITFLAFINSRSTTQNHDKIMWRKIQFLVGIYFNTWFLIHNNSIMFPVSDMFQSSSFERLWLSRFIKCFPIAQCKTKQPKDYYYLN